jgi:hypothetical protein
VGLGVPVVLAAGDPEADADGEAPTDPGADGDELGTASSEHAASSTAATRGTRRFRRTEG